ncbi:MAG: RcnB family protein [Variovorax sp.]|nr:RcnB family protein [Variovorax sp.]
MNKPTTRILAGALAALALCTATGGAFAQDRRGDDRGRDRADQQQQQYHQRQRHQPRDHFDRHDDGRYGHQDYRPGSQFDRGGFPQPHADWRRGGRVPTEYRGRNYVVNDWRGNHLNAPPRGYQWVGVGGDFVLAAIATGLIAQIISNQ